MTDTPNTPASDLPEGPADREGSTSTPDYAETVHPGPAMWIAMTFLSLLIMAAAIPLGTVVAVVALCVALLLGTTALRAATPRIQVSQGTLTVRRRSILVSALGTPTVLRGRAAKAAAGINRNPKAFVCFRSDVRAAVEIPMLDTETETPYWLISTRNPEKLVEALIHGDALLDSPDPD